MLGLENVNWIGVVVAVIGAMMVGGLWYGPLLGKAWMAEAGIKEEDITKAGAMKAMGNAIFMNLIASTGIAIIATTHGVSTLGGWIVTALMVCVLFNVTGQLTQDRYHNASAKLSLINIGNMVLAYMAMGAIQGLLA